MSQQTRHGLYGGPRFLWGSFAGKSENVSVSVPATSAGLDVYCWGVKRDRYDWSVKTDALRWRVPRDRVEV